MDADDMVRPVDLHPLDGRTASPVIVVHPWARGACRAGSLRSDERIWTRAPTRGYTGATSRAHEQSRRRRVRDGQIF
jgi:hypothetical protein